MLESDKSSLLWIIFDNRSIDSSKVGIILIFSKSEFDLIDEFIDLRVELYTKEGHVFI